MNEVLKSTYFKQLSQGDFDTVKTMSNQHGCSLGKKSNLYRKIYLKIFIRLVYLRFIHDIYRTVTSIFIRSSFSKTINP